MNRAAYTAPSEVLAKHYETCEECKSNNFGLCPRGFRLLGELANMRGNDPLQPELGLQFVEQKPFCRMMIKQLRLSGNGANSTNK